MYKVDGSTTKSWLTGRSTINKDTKGITINGNYQKLLHLQIQMKDARNAHPDLDGANVTP